MVKVVELQRLPIAFAVALLALEAEALVMLVLVTRAASGR
jgi:hypothetical protein